MSIMRIPESELEVMKVIWSNTTPVSSKEIIVIMEETRLWKNTTTLTILSRLAKKKFLTVAKGKKVTYYTPIITKDEYCKFETKDFFKKVHKNSLKSFITTLHEDNDITDADLHELDEWIKNR